jgi:hypothetical protein
LKTGSRIRSFGFEKEKGARFAAIIGVIGFADIPVAAMSIVLWQNLHPSALIFNEYFCLYSVFYLANLRQFQTA